ncbi:cbb3-type cytochrome c oxidase subunit I [Akkermansiaceae bacterium]|nr:cbb3-type cytochrome c oxidase subunit I [Akkermansiaceae bacterium]
MSEESGFFGRLTWDSLPFVQMAKDPSLNEFIVNGAGAGVVFGSILVPILLTKFKLWTPLWKDWLTSTDHKKIGIMYIVFALVMLARGVAEGIVMRAQQALVPVGGIIESEHYAQLFSTHGTTMIFFVAMPFIAGFINYVMPLQIGARDVAFPTMNQISLYLTVAGGAMLMVSLVIGEFSDGGWTGYPPFTGATFNPGVGPDYWIWALFMSGIGSTLSGINFAVTIYKMRAPGMTFMHLPLFVWTVICTSILIIFALPPLTLATLLLGADRYLDFHFFTNDLGGNIMNYANLFWLFGHPEVYILVLPAYGIFSEIFSTFSAKRLFGYKSLVYATMSIAVLSFTVWLHHFFTMGQSPLVNAVFGIATMLIAIPTGVKVYDWMATMYRGRIRMTVPMIYGVGFMLLFVLGGLTGIILANPTVDYQVHNTLFLIAHIHNVLIPGVLFGMLAGYHYWFPKAFGFRLNETWGKVSAYLWIVGFIITFFPLYIVGLLGMPRRSFSYTDSSFDPYMIIAGLGSLILGGALFTLFFQLFISIKNRKKALAPVGDPWDARTLEWSIPSPPPHYNFAVLPIVQERDQFAEDKINGTAYTKPEQYADIHMPKSTSLGFVLCILSSLWMFALVWWMWWLAIITTIAIFAAVIRWSFKIDHEETIPAEKLRADDEEWFKLIESTPPVDRDEEFTSQNLGHAKTELEG